MDDVYFNGDPATDSTRRHLERVLNSPERSRRWPWVLAACAGGMAFALWKIRRQNRRRSEPPTVPWVDERRAASTDEHLDDIGAGEHTDG